MVQQLLVLLREYSKCKESVNIRLLSTSVSNILSREILNTEENLRQKQIPDLTSLMSKH